MILTGRVTSGLGDFSKRMKDIPGYLDAYEQKTGMRFFPGTLNLQLDHEWSVPTGARWLDKADYHGTVSVWLVPCVVLGRKAWILRTEKTERGDGYHPKSSIEIAADVRLRDEFDLNDGDTVKVIVEP